MSSFTAGQSVATARILLNVVRAVLDSIIKESEEAVNKVTDSLNNMSELSESQRKQLSEALENFYHGSQAEDFKTSLNESATQIMDAAAAGDFDRVNAIGSSETYQNQKVKTKKLHDNLQELLASNETFGDSIMPLLISLQFQDKMKQELVGVLRALELFVSRDQVVIEQDIDFDDFWTKVQKGFNVVETRNTVLKIVQAAVSGKAA